MSRKNFQRLRVELEDLSRRDVRAVAPDRLRVAGGQADRCVIVPHLFDLIVEFDRAVKATIRACGHVPGTRVIENAAYLDGLMVKPEMIQTIVHHMSDVERRAVHALGPEKGLDDQPPRVATGLAPLPAVLSGKLVTNADAAKLLTQCGVPTRRKTVVDWVHRGHIAYVTGHYLLIDDVWDHALRRRNGRAVERTAI